MRATSALLVDNSQPDLSYLHQLCIQSGVGHIQQAENGHIALEILRQQHRKFDVLICDLDKSELDGIELIHTLSLEQLKIALIILSDKDPMLVNAIAHMAQANGMQVLGALAKPVLPADFSAAISLYQDDDTAALQQQGFISHKYSAQAIQQCLQQQRVVLHYQPKVSMLNRNLLGVEAMARLELPCGELLYPNQFIQQCEQFHLIDQLSYQLVEKAALQQKKWAESGFHTKVSVNLSAMSFSSEEFGQNIINLLKTVQIDAKNMVFEVTESAAIQHTARALYMLSRFRLLGAGLSIDNYGTGYSTIKHLSQFPYSELKVDRSLISHINARPHMQVIFESILLMCKRLHIELVAEGVETQTDWDYLQQAGCLVAQGYFIAPPMPADKLQHWWQQSMPLFNAALPTKECQL